MRISNQVAKNLFGMTTDQAKANGECANCRRDVNTTELSEEELREYNMSGICEHCRRSFIDAAVSGRLD